VVLENNICNQTNLIQIGSQWPIEMTLTIEILWVSRALGREAMSGRVLLIRTKISFGTTDSNTLKEYIKIQKQVPVCGV
jgi:hypothetical protein